MTRIDEARARLDAGVRIPIFPLSDTVLFPRASLPLHIFEPRYRLMVEEALSGDRLIALALLKPGWEGNYEGHPEIHTVGCAGLIEDDIRLPDGRFNIRLRGLSRVEFTGLVQETPYRIATVRVVPDLNENEGDEGTEAKRRLLQICAGLARELGGRPMAVMSPDQDVPLPDVVNTLCQALALSPEIKQRLLETGDLILRCRDLTDLLDRRWKEIAPRRVR